MKYVLPLIFAFFVAVDCCAVSWQQVAQLTIPGCNQCNVTALGLSPSGETVVVGLGTNVNLYEKPASGWSNAVKPTTTLISSDGGVFAIGEAAVASDDTTVVAEAFRWVNDQEYQVLLVWQEPAAGWQNESELTQSYELATGIPANNGFWTSVGVDAETIAVGAWTYNNQAGAAYVWDNPPKSRSPIAKLTASDGKSFDQFGFDLSLVGNTLTVGSCPVADGHGTGAIYIFVEPATGWSSGTETAELKYSADDGIGFGCQVASNTDTVAAGVGFYNTNEGRVDIFEEPASGWSNADNPTAQLEGSSSTGLYLGSTVHFGTNATGDSMIVTNAAVFDPTDTAEDIYYKPMSGWGIALNQTPNQVILEYDPIRLSLEPVDAAGANTVVFPTGSAYGWTSPINVYESK